jgi:hypothetical protein
MMRTYTNAEIWSTMQTTILMPGHIHIVSS